MVTFTDASASELTPEVGKVDIERLSELATSHVKIARRREAAWELYRLGCGPVLKSERPETDHETALVLAAAGEREAGRDGVQVLVRVLDARPRTFQGPTHEEREEACRTTAAQLLVRLWQEGEVNARTAIIRLLQDGGPQARVALTEALPDDIDFEVLEALLRGSRRNWMAGSPRAERIAWIITGILIFISGGAALVYLAAEIFKVLEISEESTQIILPGIAALMVMAIHRALHLNLDDKRQKKYFQRIAVLTRQTLSRDNKAEPHRLIAEFKELTELMAIEGGQTAREYQETLARMRVIAADSLPVPSQPADLSRESLPRPVDDLEPSPTLKIGERTLP